MDVGETRVRQNQLLFREVNQRIAEITATHAQPTSEFICECGQPDCTAVIDLQLADYQAVRERQDFFIAARGHCAEGIDRLVESRDGYDLLVQV